MDDGMKRSDALGDIGALIRELGQLPYYDKDRIAIMGGSYGGFVTLMSLVLYPDQLRAGISTVGISDMTTFLTNTSAYRRDLRRVEYGDERDIKMRAYFDTISPLKNATKITSPLMIVQGANDPRVPLSEAEQIAAAVRANGKHVEMMIALDEGHGFKKRDNQDLMRERVSAFLHRHLLEIDPASSPTN
jgi:dipeptidyl aminopeptidase/acylaminoacyl peptidase